MDETSDSKRNYAMHYNIFYHYEESQHPTSVEHFTTREHHSHIKHTIYTHFVQPGYTIIPSSDEDGKHCPSSFLCVPLTACAQLVFDHTKTGFSLHDWVNQLRLSCLVHSPPLQYFEDVVFPSFHRQGSAAEHIDLSSRWNTQANTATIAGLRSITANSNISNTSRDKLYTTINCVKNNDE